MLQLTVVNQERQNMKSWNKWSYTVSSSWKIISPEAFWAVCLYILQIPFTLTFCLSCLRSSISCLLLSCFIPLLCYNTSSITKIVLDNADLKVFLFHCHTWLILWVDTYRLEIIFIQKFEGIAHFPLQLPLRNLKPFSFLIFWM